MFNYQTCYILYAFIIGYKPNILDITSLVILDNKKKSSKLISNTSYIMLYDTTFNADTITYLFYISDIKPLHRIQFKVWYTKIITHIRDRKLRLKYNFLSAIITLCIKS